MKHALCWRGKAGYRLLIRDNPLHGGLNIKAPRQLVKGFCRNQQNNATKHPIWDFATFCIGHVFNHRLFLTPCIMFPCFDFEFCLFNIN